MIINVPASRISATWARRSTRLWSLGNILIYITFAICKWISSITFTAETYGYMIDHIAFCILCTRINTWINAFRSYTSLISVAVRVVQAFWPTTLIRITLILWNTSTLTARTIRVGPTRTWVTQVFWFWWFGCRIKKILLTLTSEKKHFPKKLTWFYRIATYKWISSVINVTWANRNMILNMALCIKTTRAFTGIPAFLIYACLLKTALSG